jgi:hypothetical protein
VGLVLLSVCEKREREKEREREREIESEFKRTDTCITQVHERAECMDEKRTSKERCLCVNTSKERVCLSVYAW